MRQQFHQSVLRYDVAYKQSTKSFLTETIGAKDTARDKITKVIEWVARYWTELPDEEDALRGRRIYQPFKDFDYPESSSAPSTPLAPAPETPEPLSTPLALTPETSAKISTPLALTPETSAKLSTPLAAKLSHKKLRRAAASRLKQKPRTFFNKAEYSNKTSYQANEKDSNVGSSRHDDCNEPLGTGGRSC